MERYRMKTIIIVILLIINGFLLVLVGSRRSDARRYEQSALERTILVLAENGIEMTAEAAVSRSAAGLATAERSIESEMALASALLGSAAAADDLGGGLYSYYAEGGTVNIRTGGEFLFLPADDPMWYAESPLGQSADLLDAAGVEYRPVEYQISDGTGEIIYLQMQDGYPLFSCRVTFIYEEGRLIQASGTLLSVDETSEEDGQVLTLPTVLMGFLDEVLRSGDVCSAILSVESGYLLSQSFSNTVHLRPVWYISTNTADYYVDGITGELTRATQTMSITTETE